MPTREIAFTPGHDASFGGGKYGIADMKLWFYLHGERTTVQFAMGSGWYPFKEANAAANGYSHPTWKHGAPWGSDLGYHSDVPLNEWTADSPRDCNCRPGGVCYYDGSGLRAEEVMKAFFLEGEEAIWRMLEWELAYRENQQPWSAPIDFKIPFTDMAAIAVGNQLRIARQKFDELIHEHSPVDLVEQLLQDLELHVNPDYAVPLRRKA